MLSLHKLLRGNYLDTYRSSDAPSIHSRLEKALQHIKLAAAKISLVPNAAPAIMAEVRARLDELLAPILGHGVPEIQFSDLLDGEVARLIGQCAIEWRDHE
jgi:hypothetical protein